jgi:hypothetical protein
MRQAGHFGAEVELIDGFFEQPDLNHLAVEMQSLVTAQQACWFLGYAVYLALSHRKLIHISWSNGVLEYWSDGKS